MKKKEMKMERKDLRKRNEFLRDMCEIYADQLEKQTEFIKRSKLRYEEWCRYQMEEFEKDHEVEA